MKQETFGIANKGFVFKANKMLIIYKTAEEAANDPDPGRRMDLPGGRLEFGENPYDALYREIYEEVGIEVQIIKPIDVWHYVKENEMFQLVEINYLCAWESGEIRLSEEHERYEWVTFEQIESKKLDNEYQYVNAFPNGRDIVNTINLL